MSKTDPNSMSHESNDGSATELTDEDKSHIQLLVSVQCIAESNKSKCPRSSYRCKQQCSICSEGKPNFQADENLLLGSRLAEIKKNALLSKEDREAINKDVLHEYFKDKCEFNEKINIGQAVKSYDHSNNCIGSDSGKAVIPRKENNTLSETNIQSVSIKSKSCVAKTLMLNNAGQKEKHHSNNAGQKDKHDSNNAAQKEKHDSNKILSKEGANRLDETHAAGDGIQISKPKESHRRRDLKEMQNAERKGHVLDARTKEENERIKKNPLANPQNDQLDEKAERLKRMKGKLESALNSWSQIKRQESHCSVSIESKSVESIGKIEESYKWYDSRDTRLTNQQTAIKKTDARRDKSEDENELERNRDAQETARKKTDARREKSEDKNELVQNRDAQETARKKTDARHEKNTDKLVPFNGLPMDDPNGKFYIDRELADVPMYQHGLKYEKWNPTQCLYELCSKCNWSLPLFTVTRVDKTSLIPSYVCEATMNGETFKTKKGAAQKKFAQHMASTKIMKYIGFDFEFHCQKI